MSRVVTVSRWSLCNPKMMRSEDTTNLDVCVLLYFQKEGVTYHCILFIH